MERNDDTRLTAARSHPLSNCIFDLRESQLRRLARLNCHPLSCGSWLLHLRLILRSSITLLDNTIDLYATLFSVRYRETNEHSLTVLPTRYKIGHLGDVFYVGNLLA